MNRTKQLAAILAMTMISGAPALAGVGYAEQTTKFAAFDQYHYLSKSWGVDYTAIDEVYKKKIGDVSCGSAGCYGAYLSGAVGAYVNAFANASISNDVSSVFTGSLTTIMGTLDPNGIHKGDPFILTSSGGLTGGTQFYKQGSVSAHVGANFFLGGELIGDACVVACVNPSSGDNIATLGAGSSKTYDIFRYDSQANTVTFANQTYTNALPQDFQADGLPISAHVEPVDLSGTAKYGQIFETHQEVGGGYLNVAEAVASAFGIPEEALSGSFLGFNYTTFAASVGIALELVQKVTTNITGLYTTYTFSSPVEYTRLGESAPSGPVTSFSMKAGDTVIVRSLSDVAELTVLPEAYIYGSIDTTIDFNGVFKTPVKVLEVKGHGLSLGPVYQNSFAAPLGQISSVSDTTTLLSSNVALQPLTLQFKNDIPPLTVASQFLYIPELLENGTDTTGFGFIRKVLNYNQRDCNEFAVSGCIIDRSYTGLYTQRRLTLNDRGAPIFTFSRDFASVDRVTSLPGGAYGRQSSINQVLQRVDALPGADYRLPVVAGVPEPGQWLLLIAGFGLIGPGIRRQRRSARSSRRGAIGPRVPSTSAHPSN